MLLPDLINIFQWWTMIFFVGIIFIPITSLIFPNFFDRGYIFAKIVGIALISYTIFVLGFLKILPFETQNVFLIVGICIVANIFIKKKIPSKIKFRSILPIIVVEESIFILILLFWSFIHAHQPEIHGLEKYMDFGFINSILQSSYFPPRDIWFTPLSINYYYFGHLVTAVLTKLSGIPSSITYNLMLSTISAFTFTGAFSIGANLIYLISKSQARNSKQRDSGVLWTSQSPQNDVILASKRSLRVQNLFRISPARQCQALAGGDFGFRIFIGGLLTAFLTSFAGNLHTIYSFFKPYLTENPVPFWQLAFSNQTFPNSYWYPNATRFIPNTIHEFPIYSSVVSDLHGHVLDIPFVLLAIAVLLSLISKFEARNSKQIQNINAQNSKRFCSFNFGYLKLFRISDFGFRILLLGFILAIMYMTNAWDGIIYFALSTLIILYTILKSTNHYSEFKEIKNLKLKIYKWFVYLFIIAISFFLFSLPFNLNFKPFAAGIGVLCAPEFLTNIGKLGPLLFEKDHCQHSSLWQLFILYGFFYFWVVSFFVFLLRNRNDQIAKTVLNFKHLNLFRISNFEFRISPSDAFVLILILLSTLLIILPEFIYIKDIYPAHYRANTMFKLVYQSFIMLSLASGYILIRIVLSIKYHVLSIEKKILYSAYLILATLCLILVFLYPYFSIKSYFGDLGIYSGLNGITYLKLSYPDDYEAILWINKNIKEQPVILEAQGDSYTDYGRVSANTGLPTVLGWTVHEWLWRGSYDVPSPRIAEVAKMYESEDLEATKKLLKKHNVSLVFLGDLERQKYPNLNENKFKGLGEVIYGKGKTKIYRIK